MEFEHTWKLLHLLWIVPLFGLLVYLASSRRKHVLGQIFGSHAEASSNSTLSPGKKYLRLWLLVAAIILIVVAIARPHWGWRILPFSGRGRDLMIVLDVSKSMNSEDVKPSRLKHAKLFLRNLIKDNPYDRFGLVAFAGSAFKECPLTVDKTSIFQALDEMNTDTIPLGGTNIENALNTALQAFQAAEGGYRAIVLITDGDELYGDSSRTIAEMKRLKIPLFVVGIGDPTGDGLIKITGADGKTKPMRDPQGNLIKSKLNEKQLRKLAESTGKVSVYVRSTETEPELAAVNNKIKKLVPKEYSKGNNKRPIERFHYPLFAAVLLLLIRFGIGERKKINPAFLLIACLMFTGLTPSANAQTKKGDANPEKLELAEEVKKEEPKKKDDTKELSPVDLYNRALKKHNSGDYKGAEKDYKEAINMAKIAPEVRSKAFQNLGVLSHQKSRKIIQQDPDKALKTLDRAEEMYRESMRSNTKRKKVVLNQQKLLDDRILAKQIKKLKEELQKKQKEAQKKTKEAHDKQKKENEEQKDNKDQQNQKKNEKKNQQDQQQNKNQDKKDQQQNKNQEQKDQNKQDKKDQKNQGRDDKQEPKDPKGGSGAGKQDQNDASGNTDQKISDAQKACDELKKTAEKHKRDDVKKQAEEAKKELEKAKQEREKGNGEKAEEHLKNAMEKLKPSGEDKNDQDNQQKNQNNQKNQDQKDKDDKQKDPDKKLEQNPDDPQQDPKDPKDAKDEKDIDPAQASALLDLMANDEKTLRDQIKENQKRDARVKKVLKDW